MAKEDLKPNDVKSQDGSRRVVLLPSWQALLKKCLPGWRLYTSIIRIHCFKNPGYMCSYVAVHPWFHRPCASPSTSITPWGHTFCIEKNTRLCWHVLSWTQWGEDVIIWQMQKIVMRKMLVSVITFPLCYMIWVWGNHAASSLGLVDHIIHLICFYLQK